MSTWTRIERRRPGDTASVVQAVGVVTVYVAIVVALMYPVAQAAGYLL